MKTHTITRGAALVGTIVAVIASRLVAFVAGCIFVAGAASLLFADVVLHHAAIGLPHILTLVTLSGTLLVGHIMGEAWGGRYWLRAIGFGLLFVVGTALVVYQSSGKQAETTYQSQAEADFNDNERARIKPLLAKDQKRLSDTMDAIDADCVKGKKSKKHCDALRETQGVYSAAVKGHNSELARLGPPKPVEPEAENIANVAAVFGVEKAKVKAGAVLVVPFIRTILFELGGLWCLGFAFRPLPKRAGQPATAATQDTATPATQRGCEKGNRNASHGVTADEQSDFNGNVADHPALLRSGNPGKPGNWGDGGNGGGTSIHNPGKPDKPNNGGLTVVNGGKSGKRPSSRQEFEQNVVTRLALGQSIDRQDELADSHGVHKGTASKWLKQMRKSGLIPAAQRVGRCHRLVAAE